MLINLGASATPGPNGGGTLALSTGPLPPSGSNYTRMDYPSINADMAAANSTMRSSPDGRAPSWRPVQEQRPLTPAVIIGEPIPKRMVRLVVHQLGLTSP